MVGSHVTVCHGGESYDSLSWWGVTWQVIEEEIGDTTSIVGKWREMNSCCFAQLFCSAAFLLLHSLGPQHTG